MAKILCFDTETTGLYPSNCGIHQLSGQIIEIKEHSVKKLDQFDFKMKPFAGKRIYQSALEVGGITYNTLESYSEPKIAYREFVSILSKHVDKFNKDDKMFLMGYNSLAFDIPFLRQWFIDCGDRFFGSYFWSGGIDVMSESTRVLVNIRPYMIDFKLGTVAKTIGLKFDENDLHNAMIDINLTVDIFIEVLKNPSIRTLEGLNIGKMKEEVLRHKEEQKKEFKKKGPDDYVLFK